MVPRRKAGEASISTASANERGRFRGSRDADLIARREAVLIGAAQKPDFDFDKLVKAIGNASEIH